MAKTGEFIKNDGKKVVARNRRASFDYHLEEEFEAGLVLTGTEVKSLREGRASITDGYAHIDRGEAWIENIYIPEYLQGCLLYTSDAADDCCRV